MSSFRPFAYSDEKYQAKNDSLNAGKVSSFISAGTNIPLNTIFLRVKDTASKLNKLCKIARQHLSQKDPLLFLVPNKASFYFLDKLFWSTENFLPDPTPLLTLSLELRRIRPFSTSVLPHFSKMLNHLRI